MTIFSVQGFKKGLSGLLKIVAGEYIRKRIQDTIAQDVASSLLIGELKGFLSWELTISYRACTQ